MENAELKANLQKESKQHAATLGYWVKAEKAFGELLKSCQKSHKGQEWGDADYYEEDNNVGDIEEECESTEEGDPTTEA